MRPPIHRPINVDVAPGITRRGFVPCRFNWSHWTEDHYDPPRERLGLVAFGGEVPRWYLVRASGAAGFKSLCREGFLLFGKPPWRRAQVIVVPGRLAAMDAAIAALPRPGPDFGFLDVDEFDPEDPVFRVGQPALSPADAALARIRARGTLL